MTYSLAELLRMAAQCKTKEERIAFLRKHDTVPLRRILRYAYDSRVKWILPEGDIKYKPLPVDQQLNSELMLHKEARTCYLFLTGDDEWNPNVKMEKRVKLFEELLESVHPADAELLLACRRRELPYKEITPELVKEAFPGLIV